MCILSGFYTWFYVWLIGDFRDYGHYQGRHLQIAINLLGGRKPDPAEKFPNSPAILLQPLKTRSRRKINPVVAEK
jgi:hypothetical protein